jgi:SAM-dependent methyltransferase
MDAMKQDEIWDERAARDYDTPGTGMFAAEVLGPAVERLAELSAGGPVLEFAIGTGRVAIPLLERGVAVSGIELSRPMIDRLRAKVDEHSLPVVHGDMVTAQVAGTFRLVYVVFNSISNLLTQAEQVACVGNAARHLDPGGRFVVELFVPDLRALPPGRTAATFENEPGLIGIDTWDVANQRLVSHHFRFSPELGTDRKAHVFRTPHRYIWPSELDLMARLAGLEFEDRYANWTGAPFTAESTSHISVYQRPLAPRETRAMIPRMATTRRADMFTADGKPSDDDLRENGPTLGDERTTLVESLRCQRLTLEMKCVGLDAEAMARRSVEPSTMSLLGLVRHLAEVERSTFRVMMAGQDVPRLFCSDTDRDGDFDGAVADPRVVADAWKAWRAEVDFATRFVADAGSLDITGDDPFNQHGGGGGSMSLRAVLVGMIEEYARHMGHVDLLRERIDGRLGQ